MHFDNIADVIGVLGFLIGLITFIITRFENRKQISIFLSTLPYCDLEKYEGVNVEDECYSPDSDNFDTMILISVFNNGNKSVLLNSNSITIHIKDKNLRYEIEWLGKKAFKNNLFPGETAYFSVFLDSVEHECKISNNDKSIYSILASIEDTKRKKFKSKKFQYLTEVSAIEVN